MSVIDCVLVTWPNHPLRVEYLKHTWDTFQKYLTASEHELRFLCSSESEVDPTRPWCGDDLVKFCDDNHIPLSWHEGPASLGAGMNAALRCTTSDLILLAQDDYELLCPLDLSPAANLLVQFPEVDLVRFLWPEVLGCKFDGDVDGWRKFDLTAPWPYGDETALRHRRLMHKYGWYQEGIGHAAEGDMLWRLVKNNATIVAADKMYFGNFGAVSAVPIAKEKRSRKVSR